MSYSWNLLICIKFCKTTGSSSLLCAFGLHKKCFNPQCSPVYGNLIVVLSFYCLSNVKFSSLIRLGNWFNCLLLLMHICSKIQSRTKKGRGKSGITLSLFDRNLEREVQFNFCAVSVIRLIEILMLILFTLTAPKTAISYLVPNRAPAKGYENYNVSGIVRMVQKVMSTYKIKNFSISFFFEIL